MIYILFFILLLIIAILIVTNIVIFNNNYKKQNINGNYNIIKGGMEINNFSYFTDNPTCINDNVLKIKSDITRIDDCSLSRLVNPISEIIFYRRTNNIPLIIGNNAFANCKYLSRVIQAKIESEFSSVLTVARRDSENYLWPSFITEIGAGAFQNTGLTSINLINLSKLKIIGDYTFCNGVFYNCRSLTEIILPASLIEIGNDTFQNCSALISVNFSNLLNLTKIGRFIFSYCSALTDVILPPYITEVDYGTFKGCAALTSINLSDLSKLKKISSEMFSNCINLPELILPGSITEIDQGAFDGCRSLASINFSNLLELKKINNGVFYDCSSLTEIILPGSITEIDNSAFGGCISLTSINFSNLLELKKINLYLFERCSSLIEIILPVSITEIVNSAFNGCSNMNIVLPQQFTSTEELIRIGISNPSIRIIVCGSEEYYNLPTIKKQISDPRKEILTFIHSSRKTRSQTTPVSETSNKIELLSRVFKSESPAGSNATRNITSFLGCNI